MKINSILFVLLIIVTSVNAQTSPRSANFVGASYGSSNFTDSDMDYLFNPATTYEGTMIIFSNSIGGCLNLWVINQDTDYEVGNVSQLGLSGDVIFHTPFNHNASTNFVGYAGAGIGYQKTTITNYWDDDSAEEGGLSFDIVGGGQINFSKIGIFGEYKMILSKSGDLDVGSNGFRIGLRYQIN